MGQVPSDHRPLRIGVGDVENPNAHAYQPGPIQHPGYLSQIRTFLPLNEFAEEISSIILHHISRQGNEDFLPWLQVPYAGRSYRAEQFPGGNIIFTGAVAQDRWRFVPNRDIIERNIVYLVRRIPDFARDYFAQVAVAFTSSEFRRRSETLRMLFCGALNSGIHPNLDRHELMYTVLFAFCVTITLHTFRVQFLDDESGEMVFADEPQRRAMAQTEIMIFLEQFYETFESYRHRINEWQGRYLRRPGWYMPRQLSNRFMQAHRYNWGLYFL